MSECSTVLAERPSLRDATAFEGSPGCPAAARDFTTAFLVRARAAGAKVDERAADAVRLVVSELVTNAAKYAPGPCLLDLELCGDTVRVAVWDTEPSLPSRHEPDPTRVGRHGLEIVGALCRRFEAERRAGGKRVTAEIAVA